MGSELIKETGNEFQMLGPLIKDAELLCIRSTNVLETFRF